MKAKEYNELKSKFFNAELDHITEKKLQMIVEDEDSNEKDHIGIYLRAMSELKKEELPDRNFDDEMLQLLAANPNKKAVWNQSWYRIASVAATVIIFISIWMTVFNKNEVYGTITDPSIAFAETKLILKDVTKKLNKGVTPVKQSIKQVDKGIKQSENIKKAGKAIENLKKIDKINETESLLRSFTKVTIKAG